MNLPFLLVVAVFGLTCVAWKQQSKPLAWFAEIPRQDWFRFGPLILVGYAIVYFSVSYLGQMFADNELRFLGFLAHPLTAFFFSVSITVLLQASFISEFAVLFAAAGTVSLPIAVALVLGGNVGTCVTNTVVSFLNFRDPQQFFRSFAASIVHDLFNITMVFFVFPSELSTEFFSRHSMSIAQALGGGDLFPRLDSPPPVLSAPTSSAPDVFTSIVAIAWTLVGILLIVVNLRKLFFARIEETLANSVFVSRAKSVICGIGFTFLVQSSSLSTSMIVPLVGNGTVPLRRAFYYMLGCNVGTAFVTIALTLPVLVAGPTRGTAVALSHLLFNGYGLLIFLIFPFLGDALCHVAEHISFRVHRWSRWRLASTLVGVYYLAPAILFLLCWQLL